MALKQGIHERITPTVYMADPAISRSDLELVGKAPAFYRWAKSSQDEESSKAMDLGYAFHTAILEPDLFDTRHVLSQYDEFRTNEAKKWRDGIKAEGKTILKKDARDSLLAMAISARQHPKFGEMMRNAYRELTVVAKHEGTGILRKSRPDLVPTGKALVDFKSTKDASPEGFGVEVWNYQYFCQAAHYLDCWNAINDKKKSEFMFFACENTPPYLCAVYVTPFELIEYGRKLNNARLYTLAHCLKSNVWGGYPTEIDEFQLKPWMQKEIEATQ